MGNPELIICRSGWEKALCIWLDHNKSVTKWVSEEVVVQYLCPTDRKMHRYFLDFFVEIKDKKGDIRKLLIEVKPKSQTVPPKSTKGKRRATLLEEQLTYIKNDAKWKAAREWAKKNGAEFVIWTEDHLIALGVKIGTK